MTIDSLMTVIAFAITIFSTGYSIGYHIGRMSEKITKK